jgi:hypothetical protein
MPFTDLQPYPRAALVYDHQKVLLEIKQTKRWLN